MSDNTGIEWTDATWNPVTGCTRISDGCDHCYIERTPPFRMSRRQFDGEGIGATTGLLLHGDRLTQPLSWQKPRRIFVNSLSDLFHRQVPDDYIAQTFAVMALARRHTFQLLTKRPARMQALLSSSAFEAAVAQSTATWARFGPSDWEAHWEWPLPNVWGGASVENQYWADRRIQLLLATPLAVRFLSCEPLLGPVDLGGWTVSPDDGTTVGLPIDWVIAGGESGAGARPMHPSWARSLRDQCVEAGVPFLFKQWGEWAPHDVARPTYSQLDSHGTRWDGTDHAMARVGKKHAGRLLDGCTWDQYPAGAAA